MALQEELKGIEAKRIYAEAVALFPVTGKGADALVAEGEPDGDYTPLYAGIIGLKEQLVRSGLPQEEIDHMVKGAACFALILTRYADSASMPQL